VTQHRKPEERIEEILDVAAEIVEEGGYKQLSMESVAARTELSKAGVYRFFPNRHAIALALFRRLYLRVLDFEPDEALSWQLPVQDTLYRLLFDHFGNPEDGRDRAVWLQLLPETLSDRAFARERRRLQKLARARFRSLVLKLADRAGLPVTKELEARLEIALSLGVALLEGLSLQEGSGARARAEQSLLLRRFLDAMVAYAIDQG
jgi:AcrR family transcriptional regulator